MSYISSMNKNTGNKEKDAGATPFYNQTVLDHFTNPRNIGEMTKNEADGYAVTGSASCGDQLEVWIKVESGKIADIKFKCFGCPGAISTSSMMTVLALGKTLEEAKKLTDDHVVVALGGLPEQKIHCSLMGMKALHAAVKDYECKKGAASGSKL